MSRSVDAITVANSISETIAKVGKPLTDGQRSVIVGSLSVFLDKVRHAARAEMANEIIAEWKAPYKDGQLPFIDRLRAMAAREIQQ